MATDTASDTDHSWTLAYQTPLADRPKAFLAPVLGVRMTALALLLHLASFTSIVSPSITRVTTPGRTGTAGGDTDGSGSTGSGCFASRCAHVWRLSTNVASSKASKPIKPRIANRPARETLADDGREVEGSMVEHASNLAVATRDQAHERLWRWAEKYHRELSSEA